MCTKQFTKKIFEFLTSKKGLAIPVTYLILFASLISLISVTYSFAVTRISSLSSEVKSSTAKQNMQKLDDGINAVSWSTGSSTIVTMDDAGTTFQIAHTFPRLILNFTDNQTTSKVIFNSTVGETLYQLPPSESNQDGFYIRGNQQAIINQSAYTLTQLYFAKVNYVPSLILCYRPSVTVVALDLKGNLPLNLVRINIINLNSSQARLLEGKSFLRVASLGVASETIHYNLNQSTSSIALTSMLDGTRTTVQLPIYSDNAGAAVDFEIVVCNVQIQNVVT